MNKTFNRVLFYAAVLLLPAAGATAAEFSFGAWNESSIYLSSETNDNYYINEIKLWAGLRFSESAQLYLRGKYQLLRQVNPAAGESAVSLDILDLDQGYFRYSSGELELLAGRTYYTVGTGVLFNGSADGAGFKLTPGKWTIAGFGAYTGLLVTDSNPYNFSSQDLTDGAKRFFGGLDLRWQFQPGLELFVNGLVQLDNGDDSSARYDSTYFGGGLAGDLSTVWKISAEYLYQTGTTPDSSGGSAHTIKAMAALLKSRWLFMDKRNSTLTLFAAWATGSDQRSDYTPAGFSGTGDDRQFFSFGTYSTGFVFEPDLANLIYSALEFTTMPFSGGVLKQSTLNLRFSYYMKAEPDAPFSEAGLTDSAVQTGKRDLGFAVDLQYAWRIVSDVSLSLGGGLFKPGSTWVDRDLRWLAQTTLVISF